MALALRSLILKFKALPIRVPGSAAFTIGPTPKVDPWNKIVAEVIDPYKYDSMKEMARAIGPQLEEKLKPHREAHQKLMRVYQRVALLFSVGGFGSAGYLSRR